MTILVGSKVVLLKKVDESRDLYKMTHHIANSYIGLPLVVESILVSYSDTYVKCSRTAKRSDYKHEETKFIDDRVVYWFLIEDLKTCETEG